jgi:hypothetical protein
VLIKGGRVEGEREMGDGRLEYKDVVLQQPTDSGQRNVQSKDWRRQCFDGN